MKKQSKYWKKYQEEAAARIKKAPKEVEYADLKGKLHKHKKAAQAASFFYFIKENLRTGFPVVVGKWFWYDALAMWPFVFLRKNKISTELANHERIHIAQQIELLVVFAYLWYWVEFLCRVFFYTCELLISVICYITTKDPREASRVKHYRNPIWRAYYNLSFEKEARENQGNANYLLYRKRWAFKNYL